jgi:hypothetical protein
MRGRISVGLESWRVSRGIITSFVVMKGGFPWRDRGFFVRSVCTRKTKRMGGRVRQVLLTVVLPSPD